MGTHTPGPWELFHVVPNDQVNHEWSLQDDSRAFILFNHSPEISDDEALADASLIAAAPELLAACRIALGWMTGGMDGDLRDCDARRLLLDAIAKAEGSALKPEMGTTLGTVK